MDRLSIYEILPTQLVGFDEIFRRGKGSLEGRLSSATDTAENLVHVFSLHPKFQAS